MYPIMLFSISEIQIINDKRIGFRENIDEKTNFKINFRVLYCLTLINVVWILVLRFIIYFWVQEGVRFLFCFFVVVVVVVFFLFCFFFRR